MFIFKCYSYPIFKSLNFIHKWSDDNLVLFFSWINNLFLNLFNLKLNLFFQLLLRFFLEENFQIFFVDVLKHGLLEASARKVFFKDNEEMINLCLGKFLFFFLSWVQIWIGGCHIIGSFKWFCEFLKKLEGEAKLFGITSLALMHFHI